MLLVEVKKVKIKNLIIIILLLTMPISIKAADFDVLNYVYSNDLWYTMRGGGKPYSSLQYARYDIDGQVVFCIQPGVEITTNNYVGKSLSEFSLYDEETIKKLELIGYYGYDYPNHQTLEYRMATQALIWELISGQIVEFWTGPSGSGNNINVDVEKDEILKLISNHNHKTIFDSVNFKTSVSDEIEIIDSNNFLEIYEIVEKDTFEYHIEKNKIYIRPLVVGDIKIDLKKKSYDNLETIIYEGKNNYSQTVGFFRISEPVISSFTIESLGKIEITKLGEKSTFKNKELIYEYLPLEGVEFSLYAEEQIFNEQGVVVYEKGDLISTKNSDINGYIAFDNLPIGKYILKETKSLEEYNSNNQEYIISIQENDMQKTLTIKNELKKTIVEVPSTGKNNNYIVEKMSTFLILIGIFLIYAKKVMVK